MILRIPSSVTTSFLKPVSRLRMLRQATHKADFQGIPPTGNKIKYYQISLAQVKNGKIQGWWIVEDNLGMMMQLGMELKPKEVKK